MSAEALRDGRENILFYDDLLAQLIVEVTAGVYQLVTTTGITDRVMETLREGRPNNPYFEDLISKCMLYDAGTGKYYLNVSGGGGGGGDLQTTLDSGNSADNQSITLTKDSVENRIDIDPINLEIKSNYKTYDVSNISKTDIGGGTDNLISGSLELRSINRALGGHVSHNIRSSVNADASTSFFEHTLQPYTGTIIQEYNAHGVGINLDNAQLYVDAANVYINGDGQSVVLNDDTNARFTFLSGSLLSISHSDGAGTPDYPLLSLNPDALQFYDTGGSGAYVDIRPNQYNNQLVTWPDITGGLKTVGTFNDTFVSGVITLTDSRFDAGQPNFSIMITNVNSSSALAHAYKFEILSLPTAAKITALKQNGTTETSDVSSVRISCLF